MKTSVQLWAQASSFLTTTKISIYAVFYKERTRIHCYMNSLRKVNCKCGAVYWIQMDLLSLNTARKPIPVAHLSANQFLLCKPKNIIPTHTEARKVVRKAQHLIYTIQWKMYTLVEENLNLNYIIYNRHKVLSSRQYPNLLSQIQSNISFRFFAVRIGITWKPMVVPERK